MKKFEDLHIVSGCIVTDTGTENLMHEEGNSFAYQCADGTLERITVEGADIKVINADAELCEEVLKITEIKFEEKGITVAGIIYASGGIYVIDTEMETSSILCIITIPASK